MTGYPIHIEVRTNPEYKYDTVLEEINYNFDYINSFFSGSSTGNTFVDGTNTFIKTVLSSSSYNVTGLSVDNIYVSGSSLFNILSATSMYANNIVLSGDTLHGGSF